MNTNTITAPRAALAFGAVLALAAVCLVAPAQSGAAKTPKLTWGTYKVTVEGTQKSDWTYNHESTGACDANASGGGDETVKFSSRPTKMKIYYGLSDPITFLPANPNVVQVPSVKLRSKVSRNSTYSTWGGGGENCADGDGTTTTPPPDCGTKSATATVQFRFDYPKRKRLGLDQVGDPTDPFANCSGSGTGWPYLLEGDDDGNLISQVVDVDEMQKAGQYVVLAEGKQGHYEGDSQWETRIQWSINMKRIGKLESSG